MRYFDKNTWFWILLSALFFLPFLGGVHLFDWDEINFAEIAREMVINGDFLQMQINYEIFTEKPPLFFWFQALAIKTVGVGEYAVRLPNAILGIIVLPFLYIAGKFLLDRKFGFIWAMSWFGSILPFLYFKSGIIDPLFNFFIFNGIFFLVHFIWKKKGLKGLRLSKPALVYLFIGGISVGLGILTKGPVAYLIVGLCVAVYWVFKRFKLFMNPLSFIAFTVIAILTTGVWFGLDALINGPDFIVEFTQRQWELLTTGDAGHGGFLGYHFVVLLFGCFPASIFAIRGMGRFIGLPEHLKDFQKWMIILLWVILILFSLVGTKIIHYSSMAYYPISFLGALTIWSLINQKLHYRVWYSIALTAISILLIAVSIVLPWAGMHIEEIKPLFQKDPFALANLNASVNWGIKDYIPAVIALTVLLLFFFYLKKNRKRAFRILFFGNAIWTFSALIFFIGKVEAISQNASISFFEKQQDKEVYVTTFNYKSYAPWFYGRVMPYNNPNATNQQWLLHGETDRPVLISCKIGEHKKLEKEIKDAQFLYTKNGFYFYQRN